ncbi:type I restriction modification DNA specificity domain protein [Actinobacillus ureae ATCC 25976]|uniref:Type I restriction modification DNA specificity domain protein n=1 Tax=Actinobacillus ureae ATCC 25976 TaxID=887324 RepID=E8KK56_9PAST|nr:restriction endonuclease subunit S [Actinobacillus ureae]EFX90703.1 type I restriction modification DNA specificity domain protein [Actinobacillus ureae ATCC 25976]
MEEYKLQDLISIKNGKKYDHLNKGNIPVYGSGGIMTYVDDYLYDGEAVLLPRKGTLNNIMYSKGKLWTVDTMYYALVNEKADPYYLYAYLSQLNLSALDSGSTLPSMTSTAYYSIPVKLPNKKNQQKIAQVLSSLDRKIALNQQINAELEKMAKTLYDYWFVQFDFPDENGNPYKSSGGEMVYHPELKREVPKGWEVKQIKDIAKTGSGGTPKSTIAEYYENGDIPWINSGELNNPFIIATENYISQLGLENSSAKLFPADSILMAMYGATAGKTSLISFEATTNQAICAIMPNDKQLNFYLKIALSDLYQYLVNLSSGSARDNLSQDKIKDLYVVVPSEEMIEKYAQYTTKFYNKIKINLKETQKFTQLRDFLLPMLMNGQVEVV